MFENKDKIVLVMQFARGGELYDYLSEHKPLADTEARRLFRQIAAAVYYCHKVRTLSTGILNSVQSTFRLMTLMESIKMNQQTL